MSRINPDPGHPAAPWTRIHRSRPDRSETWDAVGVSDSVLPATAVPVGGGVIVAELGLVVTQPTAGTFVGFSSVCPHRGCAVRAVAAGTINCFCHGSRFRITDGSVAGGPSPEPLPQRPVTVVDGHVTLARE